MRVIKSQNKNLFKRIKKYEENNFLKFNDVDDSDIIKKIIDEKNNLTIYLENAKNEDLTMRVEYEDSDIYFHSKYNPTRDAERQIREFKTQNKKQVFALGFGLGYHLNNLAFKNKYDKIFIIEPYFSIFYIALKYIDLRELFKSENLIFVLDNKPELFDVIRAYYELNLEKELDFLEHGPSIKLFNEDYKEIYQQLKEGINYKKTTIATNIQQSQKWRNNIIANIPFIYKNPKSDEFFGEFKNLPVICVSAGPSLDKNIDKIKKAEGRALIMCVGTSLKPLLNHEIIPDIIVTMDGNLANYRNFKDITKTPKSFLFAELGNYYKIQRHWTDKQVFFTMKRNFSGWIEKIKGKYTSIQTGGTVAHSMVDLAYKFGADPIIFVGQDLAYTNDKTHVSGINHEEDKIKKNKLLEVEDIFGDTVMTTKTLLSMLSYFNNYISKRSNRTFIDATEGGAKIKNSLIMNLDDVINNYCVNEIDFDIRKRLEDKFLEFKSDVDSEKLKDEIESFLKDLDKAINISNKLLNEVAEMEKSLNHNINRQNLSPKEFESRIKNYEKKLKKIDAAKYCTQRILIVEIMRYKEVKSKFYIDDEQALKEKIKYYRTFRVRYLEELKKCRKLFIQLYTKDDKIKREGLA